MSDTNRQSLGKACVGNDISAATAIVFDTKAHQGFCFIVGSACGHVDESSQCARAHQRTLRTTQYVDLSNIKCGERRTQTTDINTILQNDDRRVDGFNELRAFTNPSNLEESLT